MTSEAWAAVIAVIGLFSGAFGKTLLDRWFDGNKERRATQAALEQRRVELTGTEGQRSFADNEQARVWLRAQLDEREHELREVRDSERELIRQVGDLAAQVARQEERSSAQAVQINELKVTVAQLGNDYTEMRVERDAYRLQKHDAENKLTPLLLRATAAERDLVARNQEIDQLKGHVAALTMKEGSPS